MTHGSRIGRSPATSSCLILGDSPSAYGRLRRHLLAICLSCPYGPALPETVEDHSIVAECDDSNDLGEIGNDLLDRCAGPARDDDKFIIKFLTAPAPKFQ